jgi:ABC-type multidrug transport system fused ATPase/permease subunit
MRITKPLSASYQFLSIWPHLAPRRRKQLGGLGLLILIASAAEVVSISALMPFLSVLTFPEKVFVHEFSTPLINFLQIKTPQELLLPYTLFFVTAVIVTGLVRIALIWAQTRLSMAIGADFSLQVYERTLYQPYSLHVSRNSSEIIAGAQKARELVSYIIQPVLMFASSIVILSAVVIALLVIQPIVALTAFLGLGLVYVLIIACTKQRILKNSHVIAAHQVTVTKAIQEGLGGIRDVLIDGTQYVYVKLYRNAFLPMQRALASNQVVSLIPRYGVEALGMVLIASLGYVIVSLNGAEGEQTNAIPVLGALALGAQRLLPTLQQMYTAYMAIKGNQDSIQDALNLLSQPMPQEISKPLRPLEFRISIVLNNLGFRYSDSGAWVIRYLNLTIPKGSRVGIIGATGAGKSTLIDILMGLLTPTEGSLVIDGILVDRTNIRAWQSRVGHVPQSIFLADTSIAENIALGVPRDEIDWFRVKQVAQQAKISAEIESWLDGYDTLVGERGVRLSGGQRQRIGIARALYKRAQVLVFDEATSALDNETELAVMNTIETLDPEMTILIIAHRLTTLKNCTFLLEIDRGRVATMGSYKEIIRKF